MPNARPTTAPLVLAIAEQPEAGWSDRRGRLTWRRLFGSEGQPTEALTAGVATLAPGGFLALHRHDPPEIYYVLEGTGRMTLDGTEHVVEAGDGIFIPGSAEHGIRNDGTQPLRFFYAFAVDRIETIEYRFSER
jgi:quercetin dioxygenase-like cupin family protein